MDQSKINVRYAKAFFDLAKEKNLTGELRLDIKLISDVLLSSDEFTQMLENPIVKPSEKTNVVVAIFENKINNYTLNFLKVIIEHKRENYLAGILRYLELLFVKNEGIKKAEITCVSELNDTLLSKIKALLENKLKSKIEISAKVDPDIIGGFVLVIDDTLYDSSIATQFKKIRSQLTLS